MPTEILWIAPAMALLLGYLLGSIPFGVLLTRIGGAGDLREIGAQLLHDAAAADAAKSLAEAAMAEKERADEAAAAAREAAAGFAHGVAPWKRARYPRGRQRGFTLATCALRRMPR